MNQSAFSHLSTGGANMMNNGYGGWMMGSMGLLAILFWALIIAGVVLFVRWLSDRNGGGQSSPAESPLGILKKRYAKGEIDRETFEKMKQDINADDRDG
jgi:putative membrane protein